MINLPKSLNATKLGCHSIQSKQDYFTKGDKNPAAIGGNTKTQIMVLACVSASGYAVPPMVVWGHKVLNYQLTIGEVPGTFYGLSDSGWMTAELFDQWFARHFLLYAPSARPLLLLLDGHSSHFCPDVVRKADVTVFTIPPKKSSALSRLLKCPDPPFKLLKKYPKSSARVLTSSERLAELERKKKLKEEKEKQKG